MAAFGTLLRAAQRRLGTQMDYVDSAISSKTQPTVERPTPADFDKYLPWSAAQLSLEIDVVVTRSLFKTFQSATTSERSSKPKKIKHSLPTTSVSFALDTDADEKETKLSKNVMGQDKFITVETVYDNLGNLVHIKFLNNVVPIPAKVIKIIGLLIPFHKHLHAITINSGLHADTIYELSKYLPTSHITELCLDGAFIAEANYELLLTECQLKYLSLSKCKINDTVVKTIAKKMYFTLPASKSLSVLNLSTNRITDTGAKHLADVLRSNRQLTYLNLADNMIGDEGGMSILKLLENFPLTTDEILESRSRYIKYLRMRNDLVSSLPKDLIGTEAKKSAKKKTPKPSPNPAIKKNKSTDKFVISPRSSIETALTVAQKHDQARFLAESKLGHFVDPFSPTNTVARDGTVYCYGNNALSYLNLAYNNLSYVTIKKLYEVLVTQKYLNRNPRGLVNVVIEGNNLPIHCEELQGINDIIDSNLGIKRKPSEMAFKKKSIGAKNSGKHLNAKNFA